MEGRTKCRILKGIRQRIADINGIEYKPHPCTNVSNCIGTCSMCDSELAWLEMQLKDKIKEGHRVYVSIKDFEQYKLNNKEKYISTFNTPRQF